MKTVAVTVVILVVMVVEAAMVTMVAEAMELDAIL
jgi:hypothetical protein